MNSKLLIYTSKERFLHALQRLGRSPKSGIEVFSAVDLEHSALFAGPDRAFHIVKFATWAGAMLGLTTGFVLTWYPSVVDTPLNVGGRPLNSWPAFVPLIFVLGVLFAALSGFLAFFLRLRFPEPYHPVFEFSDYQLQKDQFYLLASSSVNESLIAELDPEKIVEAFR